MATNAAQNIVLEAYPGANTANIHVGSVDGDMTGSFKSTFYIRDNPGDDELIRLIKHCTEIIAGRLYNMVGCSGAGDGSAHCPVRSRHLAPLALLLYLRRRLITGLDARDRLEDRYTDKYYNRVIQQLRRRAFPHLRNLFQGEVYQKEGYGYLLINNMRKTGVGICSKAGERCTPIPQPRAPSPVTVTQQYAINIILEHINPWNYFERYPDNTIIDYLLSLNLVSYTDYKNLIPLIMEFVKHKLSLKFDNNAFREAYKKNQENFKNNLVSTGIPDRNAVFRERCILLQTNSFLNFLHGFKKETKSMKQIYSGLLSLLTDICPIPPSVESPSVEFSEFLIQVNQQHLDHDKIQKALQVLETKRTSLTVNLNKAKRSKPANPAAVAAVTAAFKKANEEFTEAEKIKTTILAVTSPIQLKLLRLRGSLDSIQVSYSKDRYSVTISPSGSVVSGSSAGSSASGGAGGGASGGAGGGASGGAGSGGSGSSTGITGSGVTFRSEDHKRTISEYIDKTEVDADGEITISLQNQNGTTTTHFLTIAELADEIAAAAAAAGGAAEGGDGDSNGATEGGNNLREIILSRGLNSLNINDHSKVEHIEGTRYRVKPGFIAERTGGVQEYKFNVRGGARKTRRSQKPYRNRTYKHTKARKTFKRGANRVNRRRKTRKN